MGKGIRVVIDGRGVRVAAGSTLLQAIGRLSRRFSALCTCHAPCLADCCGLCVVEVEGELELKRACSYIVDWPLSCQTYTRRIRRERRRLLSALLSSQHRRCPECGSRRSCALASLARDYDVPVPVGHPAFEESRGRRRKEAAAQLPTP